MPVQAYVLLVIARALTSSIYSYTIESIEMRMRIGRPSNDAEFDGMETETRRDGIRIGRLLIVPFREMLHALP